MHSENRRFAVVQGCRFIATATVGLAISIASCTASSFAQKAQQQTFPSAEAATNALFLAVQSANEQAVVRILGGNKELVSSGDEAEDKLDREQFVQKYEQMHRLVRASDGNTLLYIGAENWPFPLPLVSRANVWYFDAHVGAQEIRFRRVGENEYTAIAACHEMVQASKQPGSNATVDPVAQYARTLINAEAAKTGRAPASGKAVLGPFHGYYFTSLTAQPKAANGPTAGGFAILAYPARYRSSGVMTFLVTQDDVVYETDLGPNTVDVAKGITSWKQTSHWHVAE
jgi:prepilin-type processing-associated H-X9-DG protein